MKKAPPPRPPPESRRGHEKSRHVYQTYQNNHTGTITVDYSKLGWRHRRCVESLVRPKPHSPAAVRGLSKRPPARAPALWDAYDVELLGTARRAVRDDIIAAAEGAGRYRRPCADRRRYVSGSQNMITNSGRTSEVPGKYAAAPTF